MCESPNRTPPRISAGHIASSIARLPDKYQKLLTDLNVTVEDSDLVRYKATIDELTVQIEQNEETSAGDDQRR